MDGAMNNNSGPSATNITIDRQVSPVPIEIDSRLLFSSDYYRKVDRTTDIAGRLPNAVFTLPPRLIQALVGRAKVSDATRKELVAECKKFFLASREYEENKVEFVSGHGERRTTITLDFGRLYSAGYNRQGQCGIRSEQWNVTVLRLIRLPPVLRVWWGHCRWFAKTTRGLYAWGENSKWTKGMLGLGNDKIVRQPRRVPIDSEVLDVYQTSEQSFFRTTSGWLGCGDNSHGQLGLGHDHTDDEITTPTPIPGSKKVTRWGGDFMTTFAFTDGGLMACGNNIHGQCGVGSTADKITTLTPVALADNVKGRVDRVFADGLSSFFITPRRHCFAAGLNLHGQLGLGSDEMDIPTPTELPVPVDDIISYEGLTIIRSGDTLLACGDNEYRRISTADTPKLTTPTPIDLPGPVVKATVIRFTSHAAGNIFVQLTDGSWVGRGRHDNHNNYFTISDTNLVDELDGDRVLPGWTPVTAELAEKLNAREADVDVMVLPDPSTTRDRCRGRDK